MVVANGVQAVDDGVWRTLDSRRLYRHARTAGFLYEAQLRVELTRRLGVEWTPVVIGIADIKGIAQPVLAAFSQRRAAIVELLAERGQSSRAAAQAATLATRPPKDRDVTAAGLRHEWRDRAVTLGLTREHLVAALGRQAWTPPVPEELQQAAAQLAGREGLTKHASTFTRRDVIRGWCEQLPSGADISHIRALTDWLTNPSTGPVVPLDHPQAVARRLTGDRIPVDEAERRYSTPELLAVEAAALDQLLARQHEHTAIAKPDALEQAIRQRPSLSDEQAAMARQLCLKGAGVHVVAGKAGTGKTYGLDAARAAFEASGIRVDGCALAARAAAELEAGAGIPATTLARMIPALAVDALRSARPPRVLVVDETAMVGTRDLAQLLDHRGPRGSRTGTALRSHRDHIKGPICHRGARASRASFAKRR